MHTVLNVQLGMGIVDTRDACRLRLPYLTVADSRLPGAPTPAGEYDASVVRGILFGGDVWGYTAGLCSLLTNIVATALIAYRTWCAHDPLWTTSRMDSRFEQHFTGRTVASLCHT